MSSLPLAPPLPPPLISQPEKVERPVISNVFWEEQCSAELQRLVDLEQKSRPHLTELLCRHFKPVLPITQDGPTCGMVALSMGLSLTKNKTSPQDLIEIAQSAGWTTKGEMFSCEWMANLARSTGAHACVIESGIQNHLGCFLNCLEQGGSILVPYDKDKNHAPFLGGGENAHWALVTGLLFLATCSAVNITAGMSCFLRTNDEPSTHCSINLEIADDFEWKDPNYKDESVVPYVAAFQGKGNKVNLWPFTLLAESNNNLSTVGDKHNWVHLPSCGIEGGLLGQAVLLLPN